ncbi:enterobactin synthetase component D [Pantoea sp. PA1]|jgi:4'-phosphopantetheinyl transferase EntD|uniref:4'-phosphopantetheinyl transferase family protein n=1 Tax=Pantoea ananas TaxID=553 RepID=UPI000D6CA190|nr:4'-phosphopantetheinyl transferase superfamily protein [Pantoea ananatis]PWK09845.1 4'-phosphopantetheinyl transferase EntD [Pantoea ananatis]
MFNFEFVSADLPFIIQAYIGVSDEISDISVCLVEFDCSAYRDSLYTELFIQLPKALKSSSYIRKADFLSGRYAASKILHPLGCKDNIPIGIDRAPIWPQGWRGSISHSQNWAIVVLTSSKNDFYLGVDIEAIRPVAIREITSFFTNASEQNLLKKCEIEYETALTIAFSAKESLYKALYPMVRCFLGFEAARLTEIDTCKGRFKLMLTKALGLGLSQGCEFSGRYMIGAYGVATMIILKN